MSKTFVIGDIHGGYKALIQVLERAKVTTKDTFIFLGDYVDGWSESVVLIDFLIEWGKTHHCIFLRGNHEEMLLRWLKKEEDNEIWRFHGGQSTVDAYEKITDSTKINSHIAFLTNLKEYHLDNQNRLFVHAGFTNIKGIEYEYFRPMFWWDRTLWETTLALDSRMDKSDINYPKRLNLYKEIFIGHTPTIYLGVHQPLNIANVWNIDTGAAFTGRVSIMDIDTYEFWQSDPLPELYPDEIGRNKK